ncbi:MAG: hypothetical protein QOJ03_1021, partial [Frankiaceae bacterium]|nr:hypothetical protein [Frankiaceae bacterium]
MCRFGGPGAPQAMNGRPPLIVQTLQLCWE